MGSSSSPSVTTESNTPIPHNLTTPTQLRTQTHPQTDYLPLQDSSALPTFGMYQQQNIPFQDATPQPTGNIANDPYATYDPSMIDSMNTMMPQDGSWFLPMWSPTINTEDWGGLDWSGANLGAAGDDGTSGFGVQDGNAGR